MATYEEIYDIALGDQNTKALRQRVAVAAVIKAVDILAEASPSQARKDWALSALSQPNDPALFHYVLGANESVAQASILAASDSAVQTNVDSAVDALYP
jgi:hypothetical protein